MSLPESKRALIRGKSEQNTALGQRLVLWFKTCHESVRTNGDRRFKYSCLRVDRFRHVIAPILKVLSFQSDFIWPLREEEITGLEAQVLQRCGGARMQREKAEPIPPGTVPALRELAI